MTADWGEISRVRRTKQEAAEYYNKISNYYDIIAGQSEFRMNRIGLKRLAIQSNDEILEIGFGTGKGIEEILNTEGFTGKVTGIDLSDGMLSKTMSRLEGREDRFRLICGDAKSLPFEDEKFDGIFMGFTLELFDTPEIPLIMAECLRVLKKNGRICVVAMSKRKINLMVRIYELIHTKFPKQVDCRPIYTPQILIKADFKVIDSIEQKMFGLPVDIVIGEKT